MKRFLAPQFLTLGLCLAISPSFAISKSPTKAKLTSNKKLKNKKKKKKNQSRYKIFAGLENFQRLNTPIQQSKSSNWLEGSFDYKHKEDNWYGRYHHDLRLYLNNQDISQSISEAYIGYIDESNSQYELGRKVLNWQPNEAFWQLDNINGQRGFRLMDSKQEGLPGLSIINRAGVLKTHIFLSYFYIPSLNPGVDVESGKVTSNSDWVKLPPTQTIIAGEETSIFYKLNRPATSKVLFKKTLGINLEVKPVKDLKLSAFSIYKPESNLRVNAEAYYDPSIGEVVVEASPIVNHEFVMGGIATLKQDNMTYIAGATYIDPTAKVGADFDSLEVNYEKDKKNFETEFFKIEPKYDQELYVHGSATLKEFDYILTLNAIHYLSDHNKGSDDLYSDTVKWKTAVGAGAMFRFNSQFITTGTLRYDLKRKDNLLHINGTYSPLKDLGLTIGVETLKSPDSSSYWASYRTNDTVYTRLTYQF